MTNSDLPDMENAAPQVAETLPETAQTFPSEASIPEDRESSEALKADLMSPVEDQELSLPDLPGEEEGLHDESEDSFFPEDGDDLDDQLDETLLPDSLAGSAGPVNGEEEPIVPQAVSADELRVAREVIEQKRAYLQEMESLLRYEDKPALIREIHTLEEHLRSLDQMAGSAAGGRDTQAREFSRQYQDHVAQVLRQHPDAGVPGTPFYSRMLELDEQLRVSANPQYHAVDKPLRIAAMVAREMEDMAVLTQAQASGHGIPGASFLPMVASGTARTTSTPVSAAESAIASVNTPDQLDALKRRYFGRTAI